MQDSPTSTVTAGQEAAIRWPNRRDTGMSGMINSVKVDPATFKGLVFLQSFERKEFVQGANIPNEQKQQKRTKDGVPVWTVELSAIPARGMSRTIRVNLPSPEDPGQRFEAGSQVQLVDMEFGVTPKRDNSGFTIWMTAGGIDPAGARGGKLSAA